MAKIESANLLLTDKDGNTGLVKSLTNKDITTLKGVVTNVDYIKDYMNTNNITLPIQGNIHLTATDEEGNNGKTLLGTSSGTLTWGGKTIAPVTGKIEWFAFNTAPDGYLVCNGASVSRETYADLFAVIGTTFGSGDGSTTFALPNLIDKFAQGSTTVGTVKSAGLPNITGSIQSNDKSIGGNSPTFTTSAGALIGEDFSRYTASGTSNSHTFMSRIRFNANSSNSIYGNSKTVQPPALTLLPCIKY